MLRDRKVYIPKDESRSNLATPQYTNRRPWRLVEDNRAGH